LEDIQGEILINWQRKVTAIAHKGELGWTFHIKASGIEQAQEIAIDRTRQQHPEILEKDGRLVIEFIQ
jgi:hypothetical protein